MNWWMQRKCCGSVRQTFTVMCILDVMSLRAATITSLHFLEAKWQLTSLAYLSRSVESPCRNSMSFRDFSNSSVSLITWDAKGSVQSKRETTGVYKNWKKHKKNCCFDSYSAIFLQLAAVVRDAVEKTLVYDALWNFFPNQIPQDGWKLPFPDGHIWGKKRRKKKKNVAANVKSSPWASKWDSWSYVCHPDCVALYLADVHATSWAPGVVCCKPAMVCTFPHWSSPNTARPAPLYHPSAPSRSQRAKGGSPAASALTLATLDLEHEETNPTKIKRRYHENGK